MMSEEENDEIITEEMLWERIPETNGLERANTYYELSARIYARGQYDEALALAESARDIYSELGSGHAAEELAQAYSAIGYNLNQLKRIDEAASAMSQAVDLLRKSKSPIALELACTLGEWWYSSKKYQEVVDTMNQCAQEHLVDGNDLGAASDLHLIGCAYRELGNYQGAIEAFEEARALYKSHKEVIHVARCDQKIASCYIKMGEGEKALDKARFALDVFETAHDHRRQVITMFEYAKALELLEDYDEALETLDQVLTTATDDEPKEFEFIVDIENQIAGILRKTGKEDEALEIERRISSISSILADDESAN
jgi:tetratricopeptide (TPR) repeat protein